MGLTLTDVLLFGGASSSDIDSATLVIFRRNILRWIAISGYVDVIVRGTSPLSLPDAVADGLKYVKAYGGTETRNVPEGYQELEYIQGTSNVQYINTGIIPNSSMEIYGKFGVASIITDTSYSAFGSRQTNGRSDGIGIFISSGSNTRVHSFFFLSNNNDRWLADSVTSVGDIYETTFSGSLQTLSKNGVSIGSHQYLPVNTTTQPMYINGLNNAGSLQSGQWGGRVYRFTVKGIADFIPAKRLSDNAIGMWDKIRKQFFTNAGTGTFTAGAEVTAPSPTLPRDIWCNNGAIKAIRPLEYLESTGTQYIDTGYVPKTYGIEIETVGSFSEINTTTAPSCLWGFIPDATPRIPRWLLGSYQYQSGPAYLMSLNATEEVPNISQDTSKHTFVTKAYIKNSNKYWSSEIDGTVYQNDISITQPETYEANILPIYLFARNNNGTAGNFVQGRIYSFKIYDNGTLVRDFIPALDTNNVPCMFDKVEGKCYYNQGTGQFIAPYLPAGYERLDYIESTGTQYIDTGFTPNQDTKAEVVAQRLDSTAGIFAGCRTSANSKLYTIYATSGSKWAMGYGTNAGSTTVDIDTNKHVFFKDKNVQQIDGVTVLTITASTFTCDNNFLLSGAYMAGTATPYGGGLRVYSCRLWNDTTPVADMIPARRISDGEIGMYDVIHRQFFTNAGTGSFIAGEYSVLPDGYTQYDYISSTGTQYIDTGFKPNQDSGFVIDYYANAAEQPRVFMIAQDIGSSSYGYGIVLNRGVNIAVYNGKRLQDSYWKCNDFSGTGRYTINVNKTAASITDSTGTQPSYTFQSDTFQLTYNLCLFALNNKGTITTIPATIRIYSCKLYDNDTLVRNFVPAKRNSDNVVGMYDTVNDVFYTNAGTGVFGTGSVVPPYTPEQLQIMVDGTVEKIKIDTGAEVAICENLFAINTYIDEQELLAGDVIRNVGIRVLNGTEDWTYDSVYGRFVLKMTERMPSAPLRTIPLYSTHFPDVHNGEAYANVPNNTILYGNSAKIQIKTTDWNSLSSFQSWLASQYNAGNPVIVVYPLATATTESVAGQTLNVVEGDNYAEIQQASIDDLELEVKYTKTA